MSAPPLFGETASLLIALAIGIGFGFALERAGLGSARKLSAQFALTDLTVFKVMFTAIVTAMLGVYGLSRAGLLDLSRVHVPETFLVPQLAGGLLFGAGFVVAGLCPGTACVSAATGRGDGLAAAGGMFAGVLAAGIGFTSLQTFYESTPRGALLLPELLGVTEGAAVAIVAGVALLGFLAAEAIERRRREPRVAPPVRARGFLAAAAVAFAAAACFERAPALDVRALAAEVVREEDHVTASELARWIRERKPGLRIIDVSSPGQAAGPSLPNAERLALERLVATRFAPSETLVVTSAGGAHAAQAWVLLRAAGHRQVYFLRGGTHEWTKLLESDRGMRDYFGAPQRPGVEPGGC